LLLASGCTLGFDTGSVHFEGRSGEADQGTPDAQGPDLDQGAPDADVTPDIPTDAPEDTPDVPEDVSEDVPEDVSEDSVEDEDPVDLGPPVVEGLGMRCGVDTQCNPSADAWPGCLDTVCQANLSPQAFCHRNADSLHGYCTVSCAKNSDCKGDPQDSFQGSMRCFNNGGDPFCHPGSQDDCIADADCPTGEVCKQTINLTRTRVEPRCQTATTLGAQPGGFCNEDPRLGGVLNYVQLCANDNCVEDICLALCEPGQGDVCGHPDLECRDRGEVSGLIELGGQGMCQARGCRSPLDCDAPGSYCVDVFEDASRDATYFGQCRQDNPQSQGNLPLGSTCGQVLETDPLACASRLCVGFSPNFYCSSYCEANADCGNDMLCTLAFEDSPYPIFNACSLARGSAELCSEPGGGGCTDPDEVCAPFLFGEVTEDRQQVRGAYAEGRCIQPAQNSVLLGNRCGDSACEAPGACIGSPAICTHVCGDDSDCTGDQSCVPVALLSAEDTVEGEAVSLGFCY
jgi:hypothetical protein